MDDPLLDWLGRLAGAFERHDVPYAFAGGLALAPYGAARATVDIDVVIAADPTIVARAREAAADAGLTQTNRRIASFKRISLLRMVAIGNAPGEPIAVDLLLVPGALESSVLKRTRAIPIGAVDAAFASPEDIVLLKLLRLTDQDMVDIRTLARRNPLDRRYLDRQARTLRILSRLQRALPR